MVSELKAPYLMLREGSKTVDGSKIFAQSGLKFHNGYIVHVEKTEDETFDLKMDFDIVNREWNKIGKAQLRFYMPPQLIKEIYEALPPEHR